MLVQIQTSPEAFEFGHDVLKTQNKGYYVYVTEACNLRCGYCFVTDKQNDRHLPDDMVEKVLDFIMNDTEGQKSKYVHFFGGEPLIRAKTVDRMAGRLKEWAAEHKCELRLGITTNGTMLTEDNCEMLKRHGIGVQLSVDGSEEGHNVHRQIMGGSQVGLAPSGAFHLIKFENYFKYFGGKSPNCRMTVTPQNLEYLLRSLQELSELHGFKSFSVVGEGDSVWSKADIQRYREMMEKVFHWWATEARKKDIIVNVIKSAMDKLGNRKITDHLCQAGRNVIGITVDGEIFPCHDYSGKFSKDPEQRKSLLLGTITGGYTSNVKNYESHKVFEEGELRVKSGAGYDCLTCHARFACEKGCPYMNRSSTGDDWTVSPNYCEFNRIHTDLALRFVMQLEGEYTLYTKAQVRELNTKIENLAKGQQGRPFTPSAPPKAGNGHKRHDPSFIVGRATEQVLAPVQAPSDNA